MDTLIQLRHAPSFMAAGAARPVLAVATAARSRSRKLMRSHACHGQAASSGKPRAAPARAVSGSEVETAASSTSVQVGGKLLLQNFKSTSNQLRLKLSLQLVSANVAGNDGFGLKGEVAELETEVGLGEAEIGVTLNWDEKLGAPGAVIVKNHSDFEVYLKLLSLQNGPAFVCNGWVYPVDKHKQRIFFTNDAYVKDQTPVGLRRYREDELRVLRGEGARTDQPFQPWDRVYDYDVYNDLGNPDLRPDLARPVLGGKEEYPYPRRTKTGRPKATKDTEVESRAPLDKEIYVPCDERVGTSHSPAPNLGSPGEGGHFQSFENIYHLYGSDAPLPIVPQVIAANRENWRKDEEFARQMLAGANPVSIKRVTKFPLTIELDKKVYGDQDSKITDGHVEKNLGGMTVQQAVDKGKLFVVDHHDWMMPYLKRINELPGEEEKKEISKRKAYATRTLLFLNDDWTLKPLAIELSSPNPENEALGAISTVYTPPEHAVDVTSDSFTTWELAKAHAAVNDACANNFIYHWINTHATMEPIVIAANRQLSVLHPIHRLLKPHFRKTLHTNATARQIVIAAGDQRPDGSIFRGLHEVMYLPSRYVMEMSSKAYKSWNFTELALPNDLIKRGLATGDPKNPESLELLIKDYPYAVDGLEMWTAIKNWVTDYCAIYYADDDAVKKDDELQRWWDEVRNEGHKDHRDAPWWPKMSSVDNLVETCTTIIWLGSAYHAAVSFGQFDYLGFAPNSPTLTTGAMPPEAVAEVSEKEFLGSITPVTEAVTLAKIAMGPLVLSTKGEVYLGHRPDTERWTSEQRAAAALAAFQERLNAVAKNIEERNADSSLKNRGGAVKVPYRQLMPTEKPNPVVPGIPNSITI